MGGTGSGNYGGRPTVEAALKLDLYHLIRSGSFRPGATVTGSLAWTNTDTGEQRASIGYKAHMGDECGWVRLTYATTNNWTGQTTQHDHTVELASTSQTFGGRRWWWVCPRRGDLVAKLYMPAGGGIFASRKAHRLACRSQRQSPYDRAISQAFKRRHRLGADGGLGDPIDKPKGMRWRTFDRVIEQIEAAEAVCNNHLIRFIQQFG
ncbi:hypothetical protein JKG68_28265 [Microvirga aerilata]|uniref:Uncharacterized protein n=1 Tax=Microvirga aerilata TaxID=670292 RepID=A0A937D4Q5_9HYPH|nr:hypothetical protein [Microvirga aerilata]MBL0407805.1 hypothetical protein [Microvirga aerilata]